jgi:hypothetical protein
MQRFKSIGLGGNCYFVLLRRITQLEVKVTLILIVRAEPVPVVNRLSPGRVPTA